MAEVKEKAVNQEKESKATAEKTMDKVVEEKVEKIPKKMAEFIDWIESISVLELSQLVKTLEDRLGVSAIAVQAVAPGAAGGQEAKAEEKTEFSVVLSEVGGQKIAVIKEVRAITGLGLKDSKDLVEGAPKPVKEGVSKEQADEIKGKLEAVGATVEIK